VPADRVLLQTHLVGWLKYNAHVSPDGRVEGALECIDTKIDLCLLTECYLRLTRVGWLKHNAHVSRGRVERALDGIDTRIDLCLLTDCYFKGLSTATCQAYLAELQKYRAQCLP
jgi:hypothetical protein